MNEELIFRKAKRTDILAIVKLVWDDALRKTDRETPSFNTDFYINQFDKIFNDENQYLLVVEDYKKEVIGTCQITLLHYLPFLDKRVLVEFVRVKSTLKGQGIGRKMFEWIELKSEEWGANMIQLTTDARRKDAQSFYQSLGYRPSHIGMKRILNNKTS